MADLYEPKSCNSSTSPPSSSSGAAKIPLDRGDLSAFLQNLLCSSNSAASPPSPPTCMAFRARHPPSFLSPPHHPLPQNHGARYGTRLSGTSQEAAAAATGGYLALAASGVREQAMGPTIYPHVVLEPDLGSSSTKRRVSAVDIDRDELGRESEGAEAAATVAEVPSKPAPPRSSSKRSRAAEVHNLSEKRRRSRINEKMKALQMLIPNSNKTDKASMLDEAIEYLKHLQLQVQLLSMRNGVNLHPVYIPGVLQQPMQLSQTCVGFEDGNGLPNANVEFSGNQGTSMQSTFDLPNQCTSSNQPIVIPKMTHVSNSEGSFHVEPSIPANYGPFNVSTSSKEVSRGDTKPLLQLDVNKSGKNSSDVSS